MSTSSLIFWSAFVGAALLPATALALCCLILALQVLLLMVRIGAKCLSAAEMTHSARSQRPVYSVHVATHNEPPGLVIETLNALARQDYPEACFEVIVIDNNTSDPALWRPVQQRCVALGSAFRFLHRDNVRGAKAGALNIALDETRPDATHIVTIDADYVVRPSFLAEAARALARTGADYVQFPQAYRRTSSAAQGVDLELEEYFRSDARMADDAEAVLLTGTLCVISKEALVQAGGWSGRTTTEDAELGVRLCLSGYSGRYIPTVVGTGLLPLALNDLARQRYRWASGNFRTMMTHMRSLLVCRGHLRGRQTIAVVAQLGAWLNFSLVPTASLLSAALWGEASASLMTVASVSILLSVLDVVSRLMSRNLNEPGALLRTLSAIACRLALAPAAARATVDACLPGDHRFTVTRKAVMTELGLADLPLDHLILFAFAAAAMTLGSAPSVMHQAALMALALPLPGGLWVANELALYRRTLSTPQPQEAIQ